jgi:hypothetical protein
VRGAIERKREKEREREERVMVRANDQTESQMKCNMSTCHSVNAKLTARWVNTHRATLRLGWATV